jgi:hypothetical protein
MKRWILMPLLSLVTLESSCKQKNYAKIKDSFYEANCSPEKNDARQQRIANLQAPKTGEQKASPDFVGCCIQYSELEKIGNCHLPLSKMDTKSIPQQCIMYLGAQSNTEYEAKQELNRLLAEQKKCEQSKPVDSSSADCLEGSWRPGYVLDGKGGCKYDPNADCKIKGWRKGSDGVCRDYAKVCPEGTVLGGVNECVKCPTVQKRACTAEEFLDSCGQCINREQWDDRISSGGFVDQNNDGIADYAQQPSHQGSQSGADSDGDGVTDGQDRCHYPSGDKNVWKSGQWIGCAGGQVPNK